MQLVATLSPEPNGRWHFLIHFLEVFFREENCCVLVKISMKFGLKGPVDINWFMYWLGIGGTGTIHYLHQCHPYGDTRHQ